MLRKFLLFFVFIALAVSSIFFAIIYYATYSEGQRAGELIKFSSKGYVFKTWEGEMSQGVSNAQLFKFSVLDKDTIVINALKDNQGKYIKVTYVERYKTFPWWGDTTYYVTKVEKEEALRNLR